MKAYLLQMYCGDYYCDSQHPAGVYSTEEKAKAACHDALSLKPEWDEDGSSKYTAYQSGEVLEIDMDASPENR